MYLADQDLLGVVEVYSAPLEGGSEPIRLAPGVAVSWFDLGPDRVVFTVPGDNVSRAKLLSVPFDGSQSAVDLSKSSPVNRVSISPQGTHVLFLASGGLYSVPIDGRKAPILIVASS